MIKHASAVLSDFFQTQNVVRLVEGNQSGRTYVPLADGVEIRALEDEARPTSHDVRLAAHEIGHFVTAKIDRLGMSDYGYLDVNGTWTLGMWNAEFEVIARQVCILRHLRRHHQISVLIDDLPTFLTRSGTRYIESRPDLKKRLATALEGHRHAIRREHIRDEIERRVEVIPGGFAGIVEEFHRRCDILAQTLAVAA
jgi:hypothetical protein